MANRIDQKTSAVTWKIGLLLLIFVILWLVSHGGFTVKQLSQVVPIPTPTPTPFTIYTPPKISVKPTYKLFLLGDSMTYALGPHGGEFNTVINNLYKQNNKFVDIYNYARPSTNVLSLDEAISTKTKEYDLTLDPLLSQDFDILLIESFGYNPLSQFSREEGLMRQTQELMKIMQKLISTHPKSVIIFYTTIAPNKHNYARTTLLGLSNADRALEADERIAFIQNHAAFANAHHIPLIDIFTKSLKDGDGNLAYINPDDYIHPSAVGINFIGDELAKYIYDNNILPH